MKIGLDAYTLSHHPGSAREILGFALQYGFDSVQFALATEIASGLDLEELTSFRREATELGIDLEVGIPSPNPLRRSRQEGRAITISEHARDLLPHLDAAAVLGCRHVRAYVGDRHDRFRLDSRWSDQLQATKKVLQELRPALRERQLRVALETHADLTTRELLRLIAEVGTDVAGVTLDTGNLIMRLDYPLEAVACLAPFVLATHLKDAVLCFTRRGLAWQARPVGSGILPIADMLGLLQREQPELTLSVELHPRTYDLPIFDQSWLAYFPDLTPSALATTIQLAWRSECLYASGALERPEVVEAIPWEDRAFDWLAQSVGYLKPIVELMNRL